MSYDKTHQKRYYEKNKKEINKKRHDYYLRTKKRARERQIDYKKRGLTVLWAERFRQKHKKKISDFHNELRKKKRETVIELLGGKCIICGNTNVRHLHCDRIKGGRHPNRPEWILRHLDEFQLLCANHHNEKTAYGVIIYEGKEYFFDK